MPLGSAVSSSVPLAWRVSISLAADAAVEALQEAIARYGVPKIMNTDQVANPDSTGRRNTALTGRS